MIFFDNFRFLSITIDLFLNFLIKYGKNLTDFVAMIWIQTKNLDCKSQLKDDSNLGVAVGLVGAGSLGDRGVRGSNLATLNLIFNLFFGGPANSWEFQNIAEAYVEREIKED